MNTLNTMTHVHSFKDMIRVFSLLFNTLTDMKISCDRKAMEMGGPECGSNRECQNREGAFTTDRVSHTGAVLRVPSVLTAAMHQTLLFGVDRVYFGGGWGWDGAWVLAGGRSWAGAGLLPGRGGVMEVDWRLAGAGLGRGAGPELGQNWAMQSWAGSGAGTALIPLGGMGGGLDVGWVLAGGWRWWAGEESQTGRRSHPVTPTGDGRAIQLARADRGGRVCATLHASQLHCGLCGGWKE